MRLVFCISCLLLGCNSLLGIEEAHVDSRLEGADDEDELPALEVGTGRTVDAGPRGEGVANDDSDDSIEAADASAGATPSPADDGVGSEAMGSDSDELGGGGLPSVDDPPVGNASETDDAEDSEDTTAGPDDAQPLLCEKYCEEVMELCTGDLEQYRDRRQCLTVCAFFPEGDLVSEANENTIACRLRYAAKARYAAGTEHEAYCRQAGPGGDGRCGSNCEGYCALMAGVCTEDDADIYRFESDAACMQACQALPRSTVTYSTANAAVPDGNHVQCRLFHVTSAAMLDPEEHCEHAMGLTLCEAADAPITDGTDAGTSAND